LDERRLMTEAIALAADAMPHPNPRVGAVVLRADGEIVGTGAHRDGPGHPHAEVVALEQAGNLATGGTLIVTLEPCDHEGRTPPCTALIRSSGLARVVVGALDPDTRVSGRGVAALRKAGLSVDTGVEAPAVEAMDPGYFHHRRTGRPLVTLKAALTLDGQAAASDGTSQWITSPQARQDAHLLRRRSDAVMVGAGTVRADDPRLTARAGEPGHQPRPVVVAGRQPLPPGAAVLERDPVVFAPAQIEGSVDAVVLPGTDGVDLGAALDHLGREGIVDLLVEGGPRIAGAMWRAGLVDRGVFYLAARIGGGVGFGPFEGSFATLGDATPIVIESAVPIGPDLRVDFTPGGS
jgi:diaminohydroxyphosphoribosylaminopyrimidine deaminase/5-amino-6-(5-phosphoribosylamino)uracil reductase